ncbi:MAG: hypothetical protein ACOCV7_04940 [Desulfonatronovibrionaceae bacterium]
MKIMLVSPRADELGDFLSGLKLKEHEPVLAGSGREALELILSTRPVLVIVDDVLEDFDALGLVLEILRKDATVNTAVITSQPEETFEEKSEGLGILARIADQPDALDAEELMRKLSRVAQSG